MKQLLKNKMVYVFAVLLGIGAAGAGLYVHYRGVIPSDVSVLRAAFLQGNLWVQKLIPESVLRREIEAPDKSDIENGLRLGADWLISMQTPEGRFRYWYDPAQNRYSDPKDDNFLRQAGTAYAMTLAYEQTGHGAYLDSARRSIAWQLRYLEFLESDKAYFLFRWKAKLGGIALPMLTMMKLRALTGTKEFDDTLKPCAEMILFLQKKYNTGQFKSTYIHNGQFNYEEITGWESDIYPGETMLALAMMYDIFKDERYKKSIDWAYGFYYLKERWVSQPFLPWTISAMAKMFEITREKKYADYAIFLTEELLSQQLLNPFIAEAGGFGAVPTINTSANLEGLGDAIKVAKILNDDKLEQRYRYSMSLGVYWILQLQVQAKDGAHYPEPSKALGGFSTSKTQCLQRIDNTQHSISALVKGLYHIHHQAPAIPLNPKTEAFRHEPYPIPDPRQKS